MGRVELVAAWNTLVERNPEVVAEYVKDHPIDRRMMVDTK